jgi:hypothetical protein
MKIRNVILLAEKVVFAGIRGGHFLGREVAILLAEGWSLLAEREVFVGRMDVFSFKGTQLTFLIQ